MAARTIVWNKVTRLTHWMIAIPVLLDFFIDGGDRAHSIIGYIALVATVFRLYWGIITQDEARFTCFKLSLAETWKYTRTLTSVSKIKYPGHNPLASWAYIIIWLLVLGLGITGYMMGLDAFWGDEKLEDLHEALSNALMALVVLHFLGIALDSWKFKRHTWKGMFTGKKS